MKCFEKLAKYSSCDLDPSLCSSHIYVFVVVMAAGGGGGVRGQGEEVLPECKHDPKSCKGSELVSYR